MTVGEQIADELYGLHCDIGRLETENAKLREQVERLHADQAHWELGNCPSCPNIADLQEALAENAKLREELESVGTAAYLYGRSDLKTENAKLREARGTCHVECYDDGVDEALDGEWCSYAPPTWYLSCEHEAYGVECPSFCPVCGRQIVDEEVSR